MRHGRDRLNRGVDTTDPRADRAPQPLLVAMCGLAGLLAAVASAAGVLLRGDLVTRSFTTARGSEVDLLVDGMYRFNGENVGAEGIGWDLVTLLLVVPALALTLSALRAGSLRARLIVIGILAYLAYQYFEYAVFLAYGPLFLVYVATFSISLVAIAMLAAGIRLSELPSRFSERFPHRAMTAYGVFMVVLLGGMWLPLIVRSIGAFDVPELYGATTLVVPAFDLGLLVPVGIFTAATVYRRLPVGYLLASVVIVKGLAMASAIVAMVVVEWLATGQPQLPPIVIFGGLAVASAVIAVRLYSSIDGEEARTMARTSPGDPSAARPTR